jgi:DNA-directed RNA polymerase beta' subunit
MNINIDQITINVIIQLQESVQETVQEAPLLQEPFKRGHRTPEESQSKQRQLRLAIIEAQQVAMQNSAERLHRKLRVTEKLRVLFGNDTANSILGGNRLMLMILCMCSSAVSFACICQATSTIYNTTKDLINTGETK